MTSERDFDRLARAWLELGPDEAPDRVVTAVLQAAETTPQVRRPMRWPLWRLVPMTRLPVAAGAVAILVAAVGGALLIRGNAPNGVAAPPPSQTASPAPSMSTSPTALSNELTSSSWVAHANAFGYPRLTIGSPVGANRFSPVSLIDGGVEKSLGDAGATAPDSLQIRTATTGVCDPSMIGTYGVAVSPDGTTLTLTATGLEPCADRRPLARTWTRSLAGNPTGGTGTLELTGQAVRVTVPKATGWVTNRHDTVVEMYDEAASRALRIWIDPQGFADPCDRNRGPFAVTNATGFLSYLAQDKAIHVDRSTGATVDGKSATHVVFKTTASPGDGPECADTAMEIWPTWNEPLGLVSEQWVVDVGRHWLVVEIETGLTGPARDAELTSIVDSIRFIDLPS